MGEGQARDELAATFRHTGVAGAYRHRPPYAADGALDLPVAAELAWGHITVTAGS
jgi:hypothetical protein